MSAAFDDLIDVANRTGRPVSELLRHHFLEAVLRRLGAGPEPEFVLRGSMITRLWAAPFPRPANDLDFLGTFPHSVADTTARFLPRLALDLDDGVRFDVPRSAAKDIWQGSEFPGVRLTLFAAVFGERHSTTVDVGFGDPLVPPAEVADYRWTAGGTGRVWAVHPATLLGWKLHGLAEWGRNRWRPKDVLDLWLLTTTCRTEPHELADAIRVAFVSRNYLAAEARRTLDDPHWRSFAAGARWEQFREEQTDVPVPESFDDVFRAVAARIAPALDLLPH